MSEITVFADVACPFAHVSLHRLSARLLDVGRDPWDLRVRAWPLERVNESPMTGESLVPKIHALRGSVAPDLFNGFERDSFPRTTVPALAAEAAAYRIDPEVGLRCALALRAALFERGADVGDAGVVAAITEPLGVPAITQADLDTVTTDQALGEEMGVQGSPHFFTADGDFFCPSLDIQHDDDDDSYRVSFDREGFERFMASLG